MKIRKSAFVFHSQEAIFNLVDDVESYPQFLPWCGSTDVHLRNEKTTEATIEINFKGIKQKFSTKNEKTAPHEMKIQLIKGPFKTLSGFWKFTKIDNMSCKVDLVLDYDFSNYLLEKLIGPVFNIIANSFIDEFIKEANHRYK